MAGSSSPGLVIVVKDPVSDFEVVVVEEVVIDFVDELVSVQRDVVSESSEYSFGVGVRLNCVAPIVVRG